MTNARPDLRDWEGDFWSERTIAAPYPLSQRTKSAASRGEWLAATLRHRHAMHALMLVVVVAVLWASTFSTGSSPQSSAAASGPAAAASGLQSPAAIVPRVLTSTEQGAQQQVAAPPASQIQRWAAKFTAAPAPPSPAKPAPKLTDYTVQEGDNPFDLATSFNITEETLLAANSLAADTVLQIGQRLLVPPVSGVVVSTQTGDSLPAIASQWKIDLGKLATINNLPPDTTTLVAGSPLVLPDVQPPIQIYPLDSSADDSTGASPAPQQAGTILKTPAAATSATVTVTKAPPNTQAAVVRSGPNNFPWGQCTYWAAQERPDIGSRVIGNAASWLYSARSAGLPTGFTPRPGAIVVYQPGAQGAAWTGHVAYVTSVAGDGVHFTISEMNFPYWGRVTTRSSWTGPGVAFIY